MNSYPTRTRLTWFHTTYGKTIGLKQVGNMLNTNFYSTTNKTPNKGETKFWRKCWGCCRKWVLSQFTTHKLRTRTTLNKIHSTHLSSLSHSLSSLPRTTVTANRSKDFWTHCLAHLWSITWPSRNTLNIKYTRISTLNCIKIYKLINIIIDNIVLTLRINS